MDLTFGTKIAVGLLGMAFFVAGVVAVAMKAPHIALIPLLLAGICFAAVITPVLANMFVGFFNPTNVAAPKEDFTYIRAMMARHEYDDAEAELRDVLAERPNLPTATLLLIRVLYEHKNQPSVGLPIALDCLNAASEWEPEYEQITMAAVDMAIEIGRRELAKQALQRALKLCGNAGPAAAGFASRLDNL